MSSLIFHLIFGFASGYLKTPTTVNPGFLDGLPHPPTPLTLNEFASPAFYILPFKGDFKTKPMMENLQPSLHHSYPSPAPLHPYPEFSTLYPPVAAGIPFLLMTTESGFPSCVSLLPLLLLHTMPRASPGDCVSPRVGRALSGMKSSLYMVCAYQFVTSVQHTGIPRKEKERSEQ